MIKTGKYNLLTIARESNIGLWLKDEEENEVLLPLRSCPERYKIGDKLKVFIYVDRAGRPTATTKKTKINLQEFALLKTEAVTADGAFMDWGLERQLFVPTAEQRKPIEEGKSYFIHLLQDLETGKLFGSSKTEKFLQNDLLTVEEQEKVDLLVYEDAGFGYSVIINNRHKGMVYKNEYFKKIRPGEKLTGYIKKIREDNKIDVSLQPLGYRNFNDTNTLLIEEKLKENNGFLPVTDKSDPDKIYRLLGISKKAFKKSVGALYKQRKIDILPEGIKLVK